ncbi:MAG: D-alanine--D-alanine ligase [Deltaproteobacteria bacterium]|jgi:D-alanine-D-alanine ligase|nr:D-alanine--D-alanine ligase [Deltaproteobacteria bacterium]MCL5879538.1 D-alanine--D-alanine ligase [Deltaproteobacteria bacterium]MDA8305083.1 D-alanine--D-alanine ligase [Deltaproteobacteria bacterium]
MKDNLKNLRIGVLMGGRSAEREISLKTGNAVLNALRGMGYNAFGFDTDENFTENLKKIDLCFIALHGTFGEDGRVQGALDLFGIPYTGSGVLASAIAMDKIRSKVIFSYYGLKTPPFFLVIKGEDRGVLKNGHGQFEPPYFVKPNSSGSSVGCSIVNSQGEELKRALNNAFEYDDEILVEKYIKGREIQFAVVSGKPLGCVEVKPKDAFYSYAAKYTKGQTEYLLDPVLSKEEYDACESAAVNAHKLIGCKGVSRTDMILDGEGNAVVLEINTLPGLTEFSLVPMIAGNKGISFNELIENITLDAITKK